MADDTTEKRFCYSTRTTLKLVASFFIGSLVLHPFSMVFQGLTRPEMQFRFTELGNSFSSNHLPMAFFFGLLGIAVGALISSLLSSLNQERERVKLYEGLLPICAWCKKIRDDTVKPKGQGDWLAVDAFLAEQTDTELTHTMCPACYENFEAEVEKTGG